MHERHHARLGREHGAEFGDAACVEGAGERVRERGDLRQFALMQRGDRSDDLVPGLGIRPGCFEQRRERPERPNIVAIGPSSAGASAIPVVSAARTFASPSNNTSRLSGKWRKNVRSVTPAPAAIPAAVVRS